MEEIFKPIPGFDNYIASNKGYVISTKGSKRLKPMGILKPSYNKSSNYYYIALPTQEYGQHKMFKMHRLIAELFIPNPNNLPEVIHLDRNKANNAQDNLQWATHAKLLCHQYAKPGAFKVITTRPVTAKATRLLLSETKQGSNNPNFKGYYLIDGVKFNSSTEAAKQINVSQKTILNRVKSKYFPNYSRLTV